MLLEPTPIIIKNGRPHFPTHVIRRGLKPLDIRIDP
jgi:hypothetical protein